jgi:uncharacterized protein (TIGR02466 family)
MKDLNNARIDTWFPKSIYVLENFNTNNIKLYEKEIKKLKSNKKRTDYIQVDSSHHIESLHKQEVFKNLFDDIKKHILIFLKNLGYNNNSLLKMDFNESWYNISKPGDYLIKHIHPNSIISGAYYLKSNKDDFITFFDNDSMILSPNNYNELSYEYCNYECIPGRLLLFKSNLNHSTNKQIGKEKIVISFNFNLK